MATLCNPVCRPPTPLPSALIRFDGPLYAYLRPAGGRDPKSATDSTNIRGFYRFFRVSDTWLRLEKVQFNISYWERVSEQLILFLQPLSSCYVLKVSCVQCPIFFLNNMHNICKPRRVKFAYFLETYSTKNAHCQSRRIRFAPPSKRNCLPFAGTAIFARPRAKSAPPLALSLSLQLSP